MKPEDPHILPHMPDLQSKITISPANFAIEIQGNGDRIHVRIETRPPGVDVPLIETCQGRSHGPLHINQVLPGDEADPAAIHAVLSHIAVVVAARVAETTGRKWRAPLTHRIREWWRGVKSRDAAQA